MVKIRLTRFGRHKRPFYRIVAMDARTKANGAYIELLGNYDPLNGKISLKEEAIMKQLNLGAQPTDTVKNILKDEGIWSKFAAEKANNKKAKAKKTA